MNAALDNSGLEILMEPYLPEEFQHSDFFIGLILEAKGDSPAIIRDKKMKTGESIDEKVRGIKRTKDFVERTRMVPYSMHKRETYHTRKPDRSYRKRIHPRKSGARSHLRNFRPEIPQLSLNHRLSDLLTLDVILESANPIDTKPFLSDGNLYVSILSGEFKGTYRIGFVQNIMDVDGYDGEIQNYGKPELSNLLNRDNVSARFYYEDSNLHLGLSVDGIERTFRFDLIENPAYVNPKTLLPLGNSLFQLNLGYADGLFDEQRYERPHSNEESQTRPKIPFREISAIRERSHAKRRAKYMLVNAPNYDGDSHQVQEPGEVRHSKMEIRHLKEAIVKKRVTTWGYSPIVDIGSGRQIRY